MKYIIKCFGYTIASVLAVINLSVLGFYIYLVLYTAYSS